MRAAAVSGKTVMMLAVFCFCCFACGYRFAGSGSFPGGVGSVSVVMFDNRTGYVGAENIITNSLVNELARRGGVVLADRDSAEAVLSGTIKSITSTTVSHADQYTTAERRLALLMEVTLTSAQGEILWQVDHIRETRVFEVADEGSLTEQSQAAGLSRLAEDMSESVYNRLTENF